MDNEGASSVILIVLWALNANANNIGFWLLIRIAADPNLLLRIRSETKSYVKVLPPKPVVSVNGALPSTNVVPRLEISVEDLISDCPLLKATYLECNRLHSRPISLRTIANDFVLTSDQVNLTLRKNSYLHVPHFLHHLSPKTYPEPDVFRPERFLVSNHTTKDGKITVDPKTVRPYGGGASMCKGRLFAEREVLAFVAGFLTLWEIEDIGGRQLKVPGNVKASATAKPDSNCRVRISKREGVW